MTYRFWAFSALTPSLGLCFNFLVCIYNLPSFIVPLDNHAGTFLVTTMVVVTAIIIVLCLFTVFKEFRHRCCQLMYFSGYTRWGWIIGFKLGALCAEKLQKEVKCDWDRMRARLPQHSVCWSCAIVISWRRKMPVVNGFYWVKLAWLSIPSL